MKAVKAAAPPRSTAQPPPARRLGRFVLDRLLGKGAQASVWLAHDPHLDREVALKLLGRPADTGEVGEWLQEARAVSRLSHPSVVPVFEAGIHEGQACLVFEYVDGQTLSELCRQTPRWSAAQAVDSMIAIGEALAAAHALGIVHRDLKPSNVLVGKDGRPRVMDFGIAARVSAGGDGRIVGTPGWISPEAARGEPPTPAMDVFAAGLMLAQLLCGRALLQPCGIAESLARIQRLDLELPADAEVDDGLRAIVQRALARRADARYPDGSALVKALVEWRQARAAATAVETSGHGTLEFLLRRMRHKSDFPALGEAVTRIQRATQSETESLGSLASEILRDVALTQKLLRIVNSAHFRHAGGGTIATASRAVALIGFAGVRNLALSLVLLEHMQNKAHAAQMQEEFLRALLAGNLASALAPMARESEEVFIGATFLGLGRLLTEFYFPEEAQQIRQACAQASPQALEAQSLRVLGMSYQDLGIGVAKAWGLPDTLQKCMRRPEGEPPLRAVDRGVERMRWIARAANDITEALMAGKPAIEVDALAARLAASLGLSARDMLAATETARLRMVDFVSAIGIVPRPGTALRALLAGGPQAPAPATDDVQTQQLEPAASTSSADIRAGLSAGMQAVTDALAADGFKLNEVLRLIMRTMLDSLGVDHIVFCLRDARSDALTGRLGLGKGVEVVSKALKVPLSTPAGAAGVPDLFAAVCRKGADTLIADATAAGMAERLPSWYRQQIGAPWFLLLPVTVRGSPFGLLYLDAARPHAVELGDKELALLRTLRNQVSMAFRQAEGR